MQIRTIDYNYDWQMGQAIAQLLSDYGKTTDDFTPEELLDFVRRKRDDFGYIVINKMQEWQDDEDWMEATQSA